MSWAKLCCQDTLLSFGDSRGLCHSHSVVHPSIQDHLTSNHWFMSNSMNLTGASEVGSNSVGRGQCMVSTFDQTHRDLNHTILILFKSKLVDSPGQFSLELKPEVAKTQSHERSWPCNELNEFREAGIGQHRRLKWCSFLGTESFNSIEFLVKITGKGDSLACETHGNVMYPITRLRSGQPNEIPRVLLLNWVGSSLRHSKAKQILFHSFLSFFNFVFWWQAGTHAISFWSGGLWVFYHLPDAKCWYEFWHSLTFTVFTIFTIGP